MLHNILIIGAGIIGCSVAQALSRYQTHIQILEKGADVAIGASKANSGIVHAGFDAKPNSQKAKYNVAGALCYPDWCEALGVPYQQIGALVLAFSQEERASINTLYQQGLANGVTGLSIIETEEILALEPNVNPSVLCALHAKTSAITSPYELTCALADHATCNGAQFIFNTTVTHIQRCKKGFVVHTNTGCYPCDIVVNCAGVHSDIFHNQLCEHKIHIQPRKGEYYLLDRQMPALFSHTLFQVPTKMGKGVLISPTVHGNTLLGPSATNVADGDDVSTTDDALCLVKEKAKKTWPAESLRTAITTFAGMRAHSSLHDFTVGAVEGTPNAYETVGIESPGLSSAPAIAKALSEQIALEQGLCKKENFLPPQKMPLPFHAMSLSQRQEAIANNSDYGAIVCRCEQVTEAEIRASIRRPVGAKTLDAVKRRTRAGMGRCQGGFCSPRVLAILAEELHVKPTAITKGAGESYVLTSTIEEVDLS